MAVNNATLKTLSFSAPRNWVQKKGAKRRWANSENCVGDVMRCESGNREKGEAACGQHIAVPGWRGLLPAIADEASPGAARSLRPEQPHHDEDEGKNTGR